MRAGSSVGAWGKAKSLLNPGWIERALSVILILAGITPIHAGNRADFSPVSKASDLPGKLFCFSLDSVFSFRYLLVSGQTTGHSGAAD